MTDKVQKIREEVEKLRIKNTEAFDCGCDGTKCAGYDMACDDILSFIDSMQEEPVSEDLEEAADNALNNVLNTHEIVNVRSCLEMFRFGANWKKEQLIKEAINGIARPDDGEVWCDLRPFNFKDGDKLKLIIIKED
jgi:hypothetical protein